MIFMAKTIVKSPEENGPVLQFYKRYEIKECPKLSKLTEVPHCIDIYSSCLKVLTKIIK